MSGDVGRRRRLLAVLAAGARAASAVSLGFTPPDAVTMRAWNNARHLIGADLGWAPLSHELLRQLALASGHALTWRDALREALDGAGA